MIKLQSRDVYTKALFTCIFFIAGHRLCYSQGRVVSIKGIIIDAASDEVLERASVSLLHAKNALVIKQTLSNKNGFELKGITPGDYRLIVSFIGHETDTLTFSLNSKDSIYNTGKIQLAKSSDDLQEIIVKAIKPPVVVKNDTTIYNANAFKMLPNASVEDLLKKLPGVTVDANGNITFQQKTVEKIYIDGKEFFLNDPKIATKNLTADMVDAVEAFSNQSDRAKFTGIKDLNVNKAINLRLKKDKKKGLFGGVTANAGTSDNYSGSANVTQFKGDSWAFANFGTNYSNTLTSTAGQLQSSTNQSLNYRNNLGTKTTIVANYTGNNNRNKSGVSSTRETFLGDSSLLQRRNMLYGSEAQSHNFNATLTHDIDSFNSITYNPYFSLSKNPTGNSDTSFLLLQKEGNSRLSNEGKTNNETASDGTGLTNNVIFRRKFRKPGRSLYTTFTQTSRQQKQHGNLYSSIKIYDNSGSIAKNQIIDQQYDETSHDNSLDASVSYTEPIRPNQIIEITYNNNISSSTSDKKAFNYNTATDKYDLLDSLVTNRFTNSSGYQNAYVSYNYMGKSSQYQLGGGLVYNTTKSESNNNKFSTIKQNLLNWSPRASASFNLPKQKNLQLQYNGSTSSPTTQMLQPIPDLSNPFLIYIGNPNLKQQFQHMMNINYNSSNSANFSNLSVGLGSNYTTNRIVSSSIITSAGIQQLKYVNLNGTYAVNGNLNYGFALNKMENGNGQLSSNLQYGRDVGLINGARNVRRSFQIGQGFSLNYRAKEDKINAGISANINYNRSYYSIGENLNTELFSQNYSMNFLYTFPLDIRASTTFSLQINGKQGSLPGRTIPMWGAAVYKSMFKNKGEIRFSAFDLLNQNSGFSRSTGDNYIETREENVLRQYFMLGLRYNFRVKV